MISAPTHGRGCSSQPAQLHAHGEARQKVGVAVNVGQDVAAILYLFDQLCGLGAHAGQILQGVVHHLLVVGQLVLIGQEKSVLRRIRIEFGIVNA